MQVFNWCIIWTNQRHERAERDQKKEEKRLRRIQKEQQEQLDRQQQQEQLQQQQQQLHDGQEDTMVWPLAADDLAIKSSRRKRRDQKEARNRHCELALVSYIPQEQVTLFKYFYILSIYIYLYPW